MGFVTDVPLLTVLANGRGLDWFVNFNPLGYNSPRLAACLLMPNEVRLGLVPRPRSGALHGLGDACLPRGVSFYEWRSEWYDGYDIDHGYAGQGRL